MPPAVALASIDEKAAPKKPTTKIVEPTLPASGSKTLASCTSVVTFSPVWPRTAAATMITRQVMMPGATMPGMVSVIVASRYWSARMPRSRVA